MSVDTEEVKLIMEPILGGLRVRSSADGQHYLDILKMLFNYRLVTTPVESPDVYDRGFCYFGHGVDEQGQPRTMDTAFAKAMQAAVLWDGADDTEPTGYDKRAV